MGGGQGLGMGRGEYYGADVVAAAAAASSAAGSGVGGRIVAGGLLRLERQKYGGKLMHALQRKMPWLTFKRSTETSRNWSGALVSCICLAIAA